MVGTGESVVTFSERAGLGSGEGDSTVGVPQAARARSKSRDRSRTDRRFIKNPPNKM